MKSYPYIGKSEQGNDYLVASSKAIYSYTGQSWMFEPEGFAPAFKNITHEYLANTYGEVVSPEHAEFIIELAKNAGFSVWALHGAESLVSFTFQDTELCLFETESKQLDLRGLKQVTIPLPPKSEHKIYPQENLGETPKHFDCVCNKCGGKCCTGQCDKQELSEWPQVGDEFIHKGELVTCISKGVISDGSEVITFEVADRVSHGSCWNNDTWVKKPKTPEEELRDDIVWLTVKHMENKLHPIEANAYYLFSDLMGKYNITKKA